MKPLFSAEGVPADARIFIYGAGRYGRVIEEYLRRNGRPTSAFLDSFKSDPRGNLPIWRFADWLGERRPTDVVVVASSYGRDIRRVLEAHGVEPVFDASVIFAALTERENLTRNYAPEGRIVLQRVDE